MSHSHSCQNTFHIWKSTKNLTPLQFKNKLETLNQSRTYLTRTLGKTNAANERLTADVSSLQADNTSAMHEAQTIVRRLQTRARMADENAVLWADALAEGVGMPAAWRQEIIMKYGRNAEDIRILPRGIQELNGVCVRIRSLLAEREAMVRDIDALRQAVAAAYVVARPDGAAIHGASKIEEETSSQHMQVQQLGRFAEVYESVDGDVGEAVRQTLSERSESAAGSRADEVESANEEERAVVVSLPARRASWG